MLLNNAVYCVGLGNAAKAKSRQRCFIWLIIFSVFGYYTVDGIVKTFQDYYDYPVVTSTEIAYKAEVDFPAVTVCNLNRVNCHNAFIAMYNIQQDMSSATMTDSEKVEKAKEMSLRKCSVLAIVDTDF